MTSKTIGRGVLLSLVAAAPALAATSPIIPFDPTSSEGNTFNETHGDGMAGYVLHVTKTFQVTQVGYYDDNNDGLSRAMQIGLWRDRLANNFTSTASVDALFGTSGVTVPAGTAAALNGHYRVVTLSTPIDLTPGDYQLAVLDSAATPDVIRYRQADSTIVNQPNFDIGQFFYGGTGAADPVKNFHVTASRYFYLADGIEVGPMLFSVPEPAMLSAFGLAATMLRRRPGGRSR